jgi:hypothetical protein
MSIITELASAAITATDTITVELIEADETPAVVIVRWPVKPTVLHPRRFPDTAAMVARLFPGRWAEPSRVHRPNTLRRPSGLQLCPNQPR